MQVDMSEPYIHHMTIQRRSFILSEWVNKTIKVKYKKNRLPRKHKKRFFKKWGFKIVTPINGWMLPDNFVSQYCDGIENY